MNNSADIEGHLGHGTAVTGIIKQHVPRADIFCINLFENDYMVDSRSFFDLRILWIMKVLMALKDILFLYI